LDELQRLLLREAREPITRQAPVLDVGCGGGRWLRELAKEGVPEACLHGIDLIDARVTAARRSLPGAEIRLADAADRLPYEDGCFGLVLMFTVLSSMADEPAAASAVAEAGRLLEPGGLLLVYEPALSSPLSPGRLTIRPEDVVSWGRPLMLPRSVKRLTVAPPLARVAGRLSSRAYALLGRLPFLLTHRLTVLERT
jgi:SAM-dependent methyltransferase